MPDRNNRMGIIFSLLLLLFLISSKAFSYSVNEKPLITFVCTGNTGRSVMMEYLAKNTEALSGQFKINSRGVQVRESEITSEENAVFVMKDLGAMHNRVESLNLVFRTKNKPC